MEDWKKDRVGAAERGENPMVITRMRSGYAVIGDSQLLPGYCVLLASPQVNHLSDLSLEQRQAFLLDMSLLGEALEAVYQPRRMNYSIYGNTDAFLHAHVIPRYEWEPEEIRGNSPMVYGAEAWQNKEVQYSEERHGEQRDAIRTKLLELMDKVGGTIF